MERLTQHLPVENNPDVTCAFADYNADYMPGCDRCNLKAIANRLSAYEDTGLAPEQVARFRWIPVSERLPEEHQIVLVYGENSNPLYGGMDVGWRNGGMWTCWFTSKITHWMPSPEPPVG